MKLNNKEIGQRIREARERLNLTRHELAEIVEISDYYMGQIERGERQMSLPLLAKLVECLHLSADYVLWGKKTENETDFYFFTKAEEKAGDYFTCGIDREIVELLGSCSIREKELILKLLKTLLPYLR
ncbi:helix-turn-helix transcriptional regulator [Thermosyntropha sp.]|uniref:helix-turn-helix domain-containing protein n=1 Tax=Thermosyntropha sp. TaxID=2740820 RepID=UPI0025F16890|nr:helix-turn-helix transcriptional regulator [Thermosyntropha sp.]MBO8159720.1 helix-turn-helix transcriptional regulator [Thermosyntropha sp.]